MEYIYHYYADIDNWSTDGVAVLTDKISTKDDYDELKKKIEEDVKDKTGYSPCSLIIKSLSRLN